MARIVGSVGAVSAVPRGVLVAVFLCFCSSSVVAVSMLTPAVSTAEAALEEVLEYLEARKQDAETAKAKAALAERETVEQQARAKEWARLTTETSEATTVAKAKQQAAIARAELAENGGAKARARLAALKTHVEDESHRLHSVGDRAGGQLQANATRLAEVDVREHEAEVKQIEADALTENLRAAAKSLATRLDTMRNEVTRLEQECTRFEDVAEASRTARRNAANQNLQDARQAETTAATEADARATALREEVDATEARLRDLDQQHAQLRSEVNLLQQKAALAQQQVWQARVTAAVQP